MTLFGEPIVLGLNIDDVSVTPSEPTTLDYIVIDASGWSGNNRFVIDYSVFSQTGNLLQLDIFWWQQSPLNPVVTPWEHSAGIGVLPADTYDLSVRTININTEWVVSDTYTTSFDVVPEPVYPKGDMNCDFIVNAQDINPFVMALTNLPLWQATYPVAAPGTVDILEVGDIDGMFGFNAHDINPFVYLLTMGEYFHVPEPATLGLLLVGGLGILLRRRRTQGVEK